MPYPSGRFLSPLLALACASVTAVLMGADNTPPEQSGTEWPAHFDQRVWRTLDNTPPENPTTEAGIYLGRVLFYDARLSATGTMSCATCHQQQLGFAENRKVSVGHGGRVLDRNSMSLTDLRFTRGRFFWDERANTLEDAIRTALFSRHEMGMTAETAVANLSDDELLRPLFVSTFGSDVIDETRIVNALAQFVRTLTSVDSRYDRAARHARQMTDDFPDFTPTENRGKGLFVERCNLCHHIGEGSFVNFFGMFRTLRNGLSDGPHERDGGLGDVSFAPNDFGTFRSPSLKNVAVTGPYMHDGRLATLEEVVDHYASASGVEPASRFRYTAEDKAAIVAFLKTLTDDTLLTSAAYADPWNRPPHDAAPDAPMAGPPRPAAHQITNPAERLAAGLGLRIGESALWLKSLDANQDGALSLTEQQPVVSAMLASGLETLPDALPSPGRRGSNQRGIPPSTRPAGDGREAALADFDGNGRVDDTEARRAATLRRAIELGDGGRIDVVLDRLLSFWDLPVEILLPIRAAIREGKERLSADVLALDHGTIAELRTLIPADRWPMVEYGLIETNPPSPSVVSPIETRRQTASAALNAFDEDRDGRLSAAEQANLAAVMDRVPGGFGQRLPDPSPGSVTRQMVNRFMAQYVNAGEDAIDVTRLPERMSLLSRNADTDHDRRLTRGEVAEYVRAVAFDRLLREGVYVGGGFADLLVSRAGVFERIGLTPEQFAAVAPVLARHKAEIDRLTAAATESVFRNVAEVLRTATALERPD